ncbi:TolB family protein [Caulobacter segnis]
MWSPDSKRLIYVSERDRAANIYAYDFATGRETALTAGPARNTVPAWSPDGKVLAYVRDGKEVRAMTFDPAGKVASDRVLFQGALGGFDDTPLTWSPERPPGSPSQSPTARRSTTSMSCRWTAGRCGR